MLTSKEADDIRQNGGRVRTLFYDCQTCKRSYKTTVPATRWNKKTSHVAMKECNQCGTKVTVCDACGSAQCWQGTWPCDAYRTAGIKEVEADRAERRG